MKYKKQTSNPQVISNIRTPWLILSYSWILTCCMVMPVLPIIFSKDDEFIRWHAKHGIVVGTLFFLVSLILHMLRLILGFLPEPVGGSAEFIFLLIWGVFFLLVLLNNSIALFKSLNNQKWSLKIVAELIDKLSL